MDGPDENAQEHARLTALFAVADIIIDAGFDLFPAAVWVKPDGTVAKSPLTRHGHLDAHRDRQRIRQELIDPPHRPSNVPDDYEVVVAFVPGSGGCGVLDCDVKHGMAGKESIDRLVAQHGTFYRAVWNSPSGGANILFRKPTDTAYGNTSPWPGIDVRVDGGWVVAPGNTCAGGNWQWRIGDLTTAGPLPAAMLAELKPGSTANVAKATNREVVTFIEASPEQSSYDAQRTFGEQLTRFRSSRTGSRHEAMKQIVSWACGMHALDLRWAIEQIKAEWLALTAGECREDEVDEYLTWVVPREQASRTASAPAVSEPSEKIDAYRNLPEEFWQRPLLAAIRTWAHSRHRSADAVYACVRARFNVTVPYTLRVDTGIASPIVLNSIVAIVADSGVGKSSAMAMADEVVPINRDDIYVGPLGSGEGMAEAFYDEVLVVNPQTGKNEKQKKRVRDAALFDLDEGEALTKLGTRQGAMLLPELRKAYSGRPLGQSNASSATRRTLDANSYRLVLLAGLQPEAALAVLGDVGTGTPQRFVLFNGGDPTIPEQVSSTPLPVLPNPPPAIVGTAHTMGIAPDVLSEIRARDLGVQRGVMKVAPLDSQRPANQIKEAALLALLDGRMAISDDDWRLAGMVLDTSDCLRLAILASQAERVMREAEATGARAAVIEGAKERRLVAAMADRIVAKATREGTPRGALRRKVATGQTRHRFESALEAALADGRIVLDGGRIKLRK